MGGLRCEHPDRDVPGIKCGYPLPCPYHTAIIDLTAKPPSVMIRGEEPSSSRVAKLREIARILRGKP